MRPAPGSPADVIDLHVHLFPPRMFEAVWRFFEARDWAVHHQHVSVIEATLTAHGVGAACALSYPHKPGVASALNDFMEEIGREHRLFRPFGSVHVDDGSLRGEIDRVIDSPHLWGFKFQPLVQRFDVNDRRLDHLYSRCVETATPLIMHLGTAPYANEFVGFSHFARLMRRFPRLRVCVAHMGAFEIDLFLAALDDYPEVFLDTTMINVRTDLFDATFRGDGAKLEAHSDRICFGSDWPNVPYEYREAIDSVGRFPLPEASRRKILCENARRFLSLSAE